MNQAPHHLELSVRNVVLNQIQLQVPILAAWTFLSAGMLLWLGVALIPLAVHLWNRQHQRTTQWAAMQFLVAAVRKRAQRRRLEQWLLLGLRCLALFLFALALAEPVWEYATSSPSQVTARQRQHSVLVIDDSFSMATPAADGTRLDAAKRLAAELVQEGQRGDGFTLVTMNTPPRRIVRQVSFEPTDVISEIRSFQSRETTAELLPVLQQIQRVLADARESYPTIRQHRVYFFTDLGRNTWQSVEDTECLQLLAKLGESTELLVVPIEQPARPNLAITRLSSRNRLPTLGGPQEFEVEIRNFGRSEVSSSLEAYVDDRNILTRRIELPADGTTTFTFSHPFEIPGGHVVEARLTDDGLTLDNHRWLSVRIRDSVNVLCVQGVQGAADFLATALEAGSTDATRIQVSVRAESVLLEEDLSEFDCIFLCNLGRLSPVEQGALADFLANGGGLVIGMGDQVQASNYNSTLGDILPCRLGTIRSGKAVEFDPLGYSHPITAVFEGHDRSGLLTARTWSYLRLEQLVENAVNVLGFTDGSPAIVGRQVGFGTVVLVATEFSLISRSPHDRDLPWTVSPQWPSFPPLIHQLLQYAAQGQQSRHNLLVGNALSGRIRSFQTSDVRLVDAADEAHGVTFDEQGGALGWLYEGAWKSGMYRFYTSQDGAPELFAVNVETRESDLTPIAASELSPHLAVVDGQSRSAEIQDTPSGIWPAFRLLLGIAAGLLLLESCLSCYLGRQVA